MMNPIAHDVHVELLEQYSQFGMKKSQPLHLAIEFKAYPIMQVVHVAEFVHIKQFGI